MLYLIGTSTKRCSMLDDFVCLKMHTRLRSEQEGKLSTLPSSIPPPQSDKHSECIDGTRKRGKLFPVRLKEKREGEQDSIEKETSMKQSLVAVDLDVTDQNGPAMLFS